MKNIHLKGSFTPRQPGKKMDIYFIVILLMMHKMGKEGLEPSRLSAHDPKSCLSANSSTSPGSAFAERGEIISQTEQPVNDGSRLLGGMDYNRSSLPDGMEVSLGRVINPESAGKERTQLTRAVVLAIRELMQQTEVDIQTRDLAAFIALALDSIYQSIDITVAAWEKRGYWIKADRFRMEWAWSESFGSAMRASLLADDWDGVALVSAQIMQKLQNVDVPQRHRLGAPWVGAWEKLCSEKASTADRRSSL
jgi:hypothetical protein